MIKTEQQWQLQKKQQQPLPLPPPPPPRQQQQQIKDNEGLFPSILFERSDVVKVQPTDEWQHPPSPSIPPLSPLLTQSGDTAGFVYSSLMNVGMAVMSLEHMTDRINLQNNVFQVQDKTTEAGAATVYDVQLLKPHWWDAE